MDNEKIREHIIELSEGNYKKFTSNLIPNVDNILGVRIPILKKYAKELSKLNDIDSFLTSSDEMYFEEFMLKGLIIGYLKDDVNCIIDRIIGFVPKINNWSVCDSFCCNLKITKKYMDKMLELILSFRNSEKEYELRFMVVMLLDYYVDSLHIDLLLDVFDSINNDSYYVKMAVAWALSVCYIKCHEKTFEYFNNNNLDDFTYNKALQKCIESYRVSDNDKKVLRNMKRK